MEPGISLAPSSLLSMFSFVARLAEEGGRAGGGWEEGRKRRNLIVDEEEKKVGEKKGGREGGGWEEGSGGSGERERKEAGREREMRKGEKEITELRQGGRDEIQPT